MSRATILLVEDSYTMRVLVRQVLETWGAKVYEAADGAAAQRMSSLDAPDLVILDLLLPDVEGLALARELQAFEGWAEVPLVAFSAYVDLLQRAAEEPGLFADTLEKPFQPEALLAMVERVLGGEAAA